MDRQKIHILEGLRKLRKTDWHTKMNGENIKQKYLVNTLESECLRIKNTLLKHCEKTDQPYENPIHFKGQHEHFKAMPLE